MVLYSEKAQEILAMMYKDKRSVYVFISIIFFIIFFKSNLMNQEFYGYFNDEFYYIECMKNLAAGYVDHPPFSIYVLFVWTKLFGISLHSIRFITAIFFSMTVFLSSMIAGKLGGKMFSKIFASVSVMTMPVFVSMFGFYSMNAIEIFLCTLCIYLLIILIKGNRIRLWIPIGICTGLGLLNKHTFIIYIISIITGLLLTDQRRKMFNIWFVLGGFLAAFIFLPNIVWQISNDWPSLDFYSNAVNNKGIKINPFQVLLNIFFGYNPLLSSIWLAGLIYIFIKKKFRKYRVFGYSTALSVLLLMFMQEGRADRIAGIIPVMVSFGIVTIEYLCIKKSFILKTIILAVIIISGILFAPISLPILKPSYAAKIYNRGNKNVTFKGEEGAISYPLSGRLGWEEIIKKTADIYSSLPDEEKKNTGIMCFSFGYAGAVDVIGKKYKLPESVCGHNSYYLWSIDRIKKYENYIAILPASADSDKIFGNLFAEIEYKGHVNLEYNPGFMKYNNYYLLRKPYGRLEKYWHYFRFYI